MKHKYRMLLKAAATLSRWSFIVLSKIVQENPVHVGRGNYQIAMSKISTSRNSTGPAAARAGQRAGRRPVPRAQNTQPWPNNDVDAVQSVPSLKQERSYVSFRHMFEKTR